MNVVQDADLTLNEKRAILASWASDACAVEAVPALRQAPGGSRAVPVDDIPSMRCARSTRRRMHAPRTGQKFVACYAASGATRSPGEALGIWAKAGTTRRRDGFRFAPAIGV